VLRSGFRIRCRAVGKPRAGRSGSGAGGGVVAGGSGGSGNPSTAGGGCVANAGAGETSDKLRCGMEFVGLSAAQLEAIRVWTEKATEEKRVQPEGGVSARLPVKAATEAIQQGAKASKGGRSGWSASYPLAVRQGMVFLLVSGRNPVSGFVVEMESRLGRFGIRPAKKRCDSAAASARCRRRDGEAGDSSGRSRVSCGGAAGKLQGSDRARRDRGTRRVSPGRARPEWSRDTGAIRHGCAALVALQTVPWMVRRCGENYRGGGVQT